MKNKYTVAEQRKAVFELCRFSEHVKRLAKIKSNTTFYQGSCPVLETMWDEDIELFKKEYYDRK